MKDMNGFDIAAGDFGRFVVQQGYTATLLWTLPDSVLLWRRRLFVRFTDLRQQHRWAKETFVSATGSNMGLALEATGRTPVLSIC